MTRVWDDYAGEAWGADGVTPVSGTREAHWGDKEAGLFTLDALGTLTIMGLAAPAEAALNWWQNQSNLAALLSNRDVRFLDAASRVLGALLSLVRCMPVDSVSSEALLRTASAIAES